MAAGAGALAVPPTLLEAAEAAAHILKKNDVGFDAARGGLTWNIRLAKARTPQAIVQAETTADVAGAIKYARANKLKVAIRGGGHNYHGAALREGSLLINLSRLRTLQIDAAAQRASIGPGIKAGELIAALSPLKLAFPVAHCSDVNLSGYLLNGGWGWNFGEWGPACLSITGMEMVTAAGDILYADETHNADLYWAARGAGPGFFAVVTRFDLKLYPLPAIHTYSASYELAALPTLTQWLPGVIAKMHPSVEIDLLLGPIDESGKPFISVLGTAFAPSATEAGARVAPLSNAPQPASRDAPLLDQATTLADALAGVDATFPAKRMAGDMYFSNAPIADLLHKLAPFAEHVPPAPSGLMIATLGGAKLPGVVNLDGKRASITSAGSVDFGAYAFWDKAEDDAKNTAWVRMATDAIAPLKSGCYVGEADLSTSPTRAEECFSPEAWKKLVALRQRYDPAGLFHSYLI
jgi:FAD/FMN-containing dehydrogenase